MTVGLTVSKIDRGQRSEGSRHNETDYNWLKMQFGTIYTIERECIGLRSVSASSSVNRISVISC